MSTSQSDKQRTGLELLRVIEQLGREKGIPSETAFTAIERAVRLAIGKHFGDDEDVVIQIDRQRGTIHAQKGDQIIDPHAGSLGRIAAQAAKQQMIQLFREEESQNLMADLERLKGQLLHQKGTISKDEGGVYIVSIGKTDAILPKSETHKGEHLSPGDKIYALVLDVKKTGHRVKVTLSRSSPLFVQRLFEREIPEIEDRTIKIERVAREAGFRTKVAVSSIDSRVDCVGACVGVRGSRIKNIIDELGGSERIDIVRWNDSVEVLIRNSLSPANVDEIFLYDLLQRAIVLVKDDQLSLAIGKRGQNVRLASKLVDWDIEIMTSEELDKAIDKAQRDFLEIPNMSVEMTEHLIENGFLSYEDLSVLTPAELGEFCGVDEATGADMVSFAEQAMLQEQNEPRQAPAASTPHAAPAPAPAPASASERFDQLFATETASEEAPASGEESGAEQSETPSDSAESAPADEAPESGEDGAHPAGSEAEPKE